MQSMSPPLAGRLDLAPRARQLLSRQLEMCDALLEPLLNGALDDLEKELFNIAEQSSGGQVQHEALEALREIKRSRGGYYPGVMAVLRREFAGYGAPLAPAPPALDRNGSPEARPDLSLIDPLEFDETVALADLSVRTELHVRVELYELCHRYAVLVALPPLENEVLPSGPYMLAECFGKAALALGIGHQHRLLLYRQCDRRLFAASKPFYTHLNQHLFDAGILQNLRSYLPRREPGATPPHTTAAADDAAGARLAGGEPRSDHAAAPDQPYSLPAVDSLHDLLAARRRQRHPDANLVLEPTDEFVSVPALQEALAALQAMPSRKAAPPRTGDRLEHELVAELQRRKPGAAAPRLPMQQRDAMDLMSMMIDGVLEDTIESGSARQLLSTLEVPLLRVALTDQRFFSASNHPARRLLGNVLQTADLWLDRSDGEFDTNLDRRLQRSAQRLAAGAKGEPDVIEREADDLDNYMRRLGQRAAIAERRHVEAAQGRDRLRSARATATAAIGARLAAHPGTPVIRALLEQAWTDVLTLTLLRDGADSEAYRRRLAAAEQLLTATVAGDHSQLADDLVHGLTQVGLHEAEAEALVRHALGLPTAGTASPNETELLARLAAQRKAGETAAPAAAVAPPAPLSADECSALASLKLLPFGTWLEFTDPSREKKIARKLAWYAPHTGHCLLVNPRGVPAVERNLDAVARLLAAGQVRVMPRQGMGIVDGALRKLMDTLRGFGHGAAATEMQT